MRYGPFFSARPQRWCSTDELEELWCVEYDLIEEGYMHFLLSRASIRAKISSKYSLAPLKKILVRD